MENTVIINSIGTAKPSVSKILSEAFKMPQEFILKLLYNAPSVLFQKVDLDLAKNAETTLSKLGLEVAIIDKEETISLTNEQVEVSLFFEDVLKLPIVIQQLAEFLGCKPAESLNMLLAQPSIVLGGVSEATAIALQKRIDASVCFSNPRKDLFTVYIENSFPKNDLKRLVSKINQPSEIMNDGATIIKNVSYSESSSIWREHQSKKQIRVINQTHQLATIELHFFDVKNKKQVAYLTEEIGMPSNILVALQENLPITLFEGISAQLAKEIKSKCEELEIGTSLKNDFKTTRKLSVEDIKDCEGVKNVLAQFVNVKAFEKEITRWESTTEIPDLIARYLFAQLELLNCEPNII